MGFFKSFFSGKSDSPANEKQKNEQKNFEIFKYDGMRAQRMGRTDYAIKCFTEALAIQEDFETMGYLAQVYTQTNELDEAHKLPDAARQMYTETLSSRAMDELCLLLQQAHYKDFARQLRTAFLTLSFSCTQGFSKLRRKVSEPFVLTPFRRAALIDCIALLQNAGGLPDVPRYLLNRLGEAESLLRLFLLEVPTRMLKQKEGKTVCRASSSAAGNIPQILFSGKSAIRM